MKNLLSLPVLISSFTLFAQYSPVEIKKFRIAKLTKLSITKGDETVHKTETWYDNNGNDTAEYNAGGTYRRTTYQYDPDGQVISRVRYDEAGKESETAIYAYKADGTYTISNTDKNFGMTDFTFCDKAGKTIKTVSPDKSERIYSYDRKGHLVNVKSIPGDNGGVVIDQQFTYNGAGQLIKEISKGDNKWTHTYSYNSKGLLSKSKMNSITDGVADPEVNYTYEYEFRK